MKISFPKCGPSEFLTRKQGVARIISFVAAIFLKQNKVAEAPDAPIEENVPEPTPQWDYRPRKPTRARAAPDSPNTEMSDELSSDPFGINDNAWLNDNSVEGVAFNFINGSPEAEDR